MSLSILFIFAPAINHLNKTTMIAKRYITLGADVTYCTFNTDVNWLKSLTTANVIITKSKPFGLLHKLPEYDNSGYKVRQKIACEIAVARKRELREVILKTRPSVIFYDELCAFDVFLIADLVRSITNIKLIPTLPNLPGSNYPPLYSTDYPSLKWSVGWFFRRMRLKWVDIKHSFTDPLLSSYWLYRKFCDNRITADYTFYANMYPVFKKFHRWYLSAPEFDFGSRALPEKQQVVGPMIDRSRVEIMLPRVQFFLRKHQIEKDSKLIYCGFGSSPLVLYDPDELIAFYNNLNELAIRNNNWNILVSIPEKLVERIKPSGLNIMYVQFVPQLEVLPKTDVFITHGGGSVMEALQFGTPMLCTPAPKNVDFNGNSTRIKFHKIGLSALHTAPIEELEAKIKTILSDESFRSNARKMSSEIVRNYGNPDLNWIDLPM